MTSHANIKWKLNPVGLHTRTDTQTDGQNLKKNINSNSYPLNLTLQICAHHGLAADPDHPEKNYDDREIIQMISSYIRKRLPHVEDKPSLVEHCFYTVSTILLSWLIPTEPKRDREQDRERDTYYPKKHSHCNRKGKGNINGNQLQSTFPLMVNCKNGLETHSYLFPLKGTHSLSPCSVKYST